MSGITQTASANNGPSITGVALGPGDGSGTIRLTFDGNANFSGLGFTSPQSSASFGADSLVCVPGSCAGGTENGFGQVTSLGVVIDAPAIGWNYQTYGLWMRDLTSPVIQAGTISAGSATPGDNLIPMIGTASFTGGASGLYVDPAGTAFITSAVMNADANFATRLIDFETTGTVKTPILGSVGATPDSNLDIFGTLGPYTAGTNHFTGTVNTTSAPVSNSMSGNATGRFYGPSAEEIGGVFGLTGSGGSLIGAFGGRKLP
jgi:hypothetical protein